MNTPTYAKVFGVLALICAILSFLIPIFGTLLITPLAIIFGAIALWGGSKGMGVAVIIIIVVNLIISPTFWMNLYAGATQAQAGANRFISYFDIIGIVLLFVFLIIGGPKSK
jgi:hypothetical protein